MTQRLINNRKYPDVKITLTGDISGSGSPIINTTINAGVVGISNLSATGTPSSTTYLRGDNTWATIPSGGVTTLGAIGSSPNANGATITGSILNLEPANASFGGALSSTDWSTFNSKFNLPSLTAGSVLFSNGTTIAQDNANFFWDDTNNRLGIGTNAPSAKLEVRGISDFWGLQVGNGTVGALFQVYGGKAGFVGFNGSAYNSLDIRSGIGTQLFLSTNGNVGIGTTSPGARVHLAAGTATASTAPLKFTAGTNLTTAEAGAVEYNGSELLFTPTGTLRSGVMMIDFTNRNMYSPTLKGGTALTSGSRNFLSGYLAGQNLTVGSDNVMIGHNAGYASSNSISNTIMIGQVAGGVSTGVDFGVFLGNRAGYNASGAYGAIFLGQHAGINSGNSGYSIFLGNGAGQDSGNNGGSILLGYQAGRNSGGSTGSIMLGSQAGWFAPNATNSIFLGAYAGRGSSGAADSIFLGQNAGYNSSTGISGIGNIFIGYKAGDTHTSGAKNVLIGYDLDTQLPTDTGQLSIQNAIFGTGNTGTGTTVSTGKIGIFTVAPTCALDVTGGIATSRTTVTAPATTDGNIFSGTYTPTLTGVTNVTSSTAYVCQYMRVGNVVTVSGKIEVTPTLNNAQTTIGISLPIASNFANSGECGGSSHTVANTTAGHGAAIYADTTNDRAEMDYFETHGASDTFAFSFTYKII